MMPAFESGEGDIALVSPGTRGSEPLLQTDFNEAYAEVSPDGQWMAYMSGKALLTVDSVYDEVGTSCCLKGHAETFRFGRDGGKRCQT